MSEFDQDTENPLNKKTGLLALLDSMSLLDDEFPDIDDDLPKLR